MIVQMSLYKCKSLTEEYEMIFLILCCIGILLLSAAISGPAIIVALIEYIKDFMEESPDERSYVTLFFAIIGSLIGVRIFMPFTIWIVKFLFSLL